MTSHAVRAFLDLAFYLFLVMDEMLASIRLCRENTSSGWRQNHAGQGGSPLPYTHQVFGTAGRALLFPS
jgi:hypothetical protein